MISGILLVAAGNEGMAALLHEIGKVFHLSGIRICVSYFGGCPIFGL